MSVASTNRCFKGHRVFEISEIGYVQPADETYFEILVDNNKIICFLEKQLSFNLEIFLKNHF